MELTPEVRALVREGRSFLEDKIQRENGPFYGINTGFGELCHVQVGHDELETLQLNLIRSHACGVGPAVKGSVVRWMLVLKVLSLQSLSGVRAVVLDNTPPSQRGFTPGSAGKQVLLELLEFDLLGAPFVFL